MSDNVCPVADGTKDLGKAGARWRRGIFSDGVVCEGKVYLDTDLNTYLEKDGSTVKLYIDGVLSFAFQKPT